jgi:PIN domain nuclease of toxin-antitoxin system
MIYVKQQKSAAKVSAGLILCARQRLPERLLAKLCKKYGLPLGNAACVSTFARFF